ncbi:Zn-ribbon domain-containing OB-fold protein [Fodinicola acaciae]|uniref:Zn-ribbon domain-containing OB-fold protein n=1 Tax=Fodinicola acaciae TaxID=2681555 RepID=UPI001C9E5CA7|nr:Zn-ribbon domain-containing OB-fold protein [Fodinicola acaciae]
MEIAVDTESREFWDGVAAGELRIQRCEACGHAVFYPRALCPSCHCDRLVWIVASGRGEVYSYTVAHRAFGEFATEAPFTVALVDLDEGVRMLTRIVGGTVAIGDRVELEFATAAGNQLPCFRPVA